MKIRRVRYKNGYKRFRDLTIDLGDNPARIVALVGPNGCGKSSVLDGMLYRHSVHGRLGNSGQRDYTYHSMDAQPSYDYQNVEIEFLTGPYGETRNALEQTGKANTIFSFRTMTTALGTPLTCCLTKAPTTRLSLTMSIRT